MPNKSINQFDLLDGSLENDDLLVVWDDSRNETVSMSGQQMVTFLTALAAGKGGISSIVKTGTSGLVDTYTITYANTDTSTFTVTNGAKGDTGDQTYVHIVYSNAEPTQDSDLSDIPGPWMGIATGTSSAAPTAYTDYEWYEIKGPKGDGVAYTTAGTPSGLDVPYTMFTESGEVCGTFTVHNGEGGVSLVDGIAPSDSGGNVPITVGVEALGLTIGTATIGEVYAQLLPNQTLIAPATHFAAAQMPYNGTTYVVAGSVEIHKSAAETTSGVIPGWIYFHGYMAIPDYRMPFTVNNAPTGTWSVIVNSGTLTTDTFEATQTSVSGGTNYSGNFSCAKTGFKPIALVGFTTNASSVNVVKMALVPDENKVEFNVRNNSTSAINAKPSATILFMKL